ncbi:hypothetical protein CCY99_01100 [Helicobacter sp. 16-1353]|uniref:NAD(P)/FAD-dependent oxidoreductase n=1 Tax=Helicobacter sp. 16-1353 TaxID=2004996 RepID=UPI000DCE37B7|nr:FAD/NAD(P)-binding oxidoreductase [Helicobacter sp. 16-1353]RAX55325.1 hypothetical protein CCY99_01100 [Helicobacter sp. 16-1353]
MKRRNAIKLLGAGASLLLANGTLGNENPANLANENATNKTPESIENSKANIAIMGAGLGGISLAAKLKRDLPNASISLFDADETFYYQPGFTLIGIGIYDKNDVIFEKAKYIPEGVKWVHSNVAKILPEENALVIENGEKVAYDYLVIASGVEYEFGSIEGLSASMVEDSSSNISSIYTLKGALKTNELMSDFAKNGGKAIFYDQKTAMKCSGANKKMLSMTEDRLRRAGNRQKGEVALYCGGGKLFGNPVYAASMGAIFTKRDIAFNLRHELIKIDGNTAIFKHWTPYKKNGETHKIEDFIEVKFDFLHLSPKQIGSKIIKEAGLSSGEQGFLAVEKERLVSIKFKNIFGIGDICDFPAGKTGASIRKMYPLLSQNIIRSIRGEELLKGFDGYTACPFVTKYGKAIMVEFNWEGTASSLPCFGEVRESYLSWLIKLYGFKPMVMNGMLKGLV